MRETTWSTTMRLTSTEAKKLIERAARSFSAIMACETTPEEMMRMLIDADPSEKKKYVRWMAERFASKDAARQSRGLMIANGARSQAYRALLSFDLCKEQLPVELRNILNYRSIDEVRQATAALNEGRVNCRKFALKRLSFEQAFNLTLVEQAEGISVHQPRCIEEAAVLISNEDLLDSSGDGLYASLREIGQVLVFVSDSGVLIGARPESQGERGIVYDPFGELAVFEDMLQVENCNGAVSWSTHESVLRHMIEIDPSLPFDTEMNEVEPYRVALTQFPLILHEDRVIPEDLREEILSDTQVMAKVIGIEL